MVDVAQNPFIPFSGNQAGFAPQGFDFGQFAQQIASQVLPALPSLIMSVLSSHPVVGPQVRAQSAVPNGFAPQSLFNFGVNTPFGGGGISLFGATPTLGVAPQGFDFGQFIQQITSQVAPALPGLIASLLSSNPTIGAQVRTQSAVPGFAPQGFDFGQFAGQLAQQVLPIAGQLAQQVLPALPGLIAGLLSSHPVIGPQIRAQSAVPQGFAPQSLFNFGVNTPLGGGGISLFGATPTLGVSPQGFDFGQFVQQIATQVLPQVLPAIPGLISSLLSAHPVVGAQFRAQSAVPGVLAPQGFDFGQFVQQITTQVLPQVLPAIPGLLSSLLSAHPAVGAQFRAQSAVPGGLSPQGFDFGQFAGQLAQQVLPALPGLLLGLLSSSPVVGPQLRAQSAAPHGFAPQSLFNFGVNTPFGGGGISLFGATPTLGVSPQGFDFGQFAQQIVGQVAPLLPGLIMSVLSANPTIGSQFRAQTMH